jgi:hypothetical protein
MRIENFSKLKRSDHSPKPDEFIDVSLDPSYFSLDSPFKFHLKKVCSRVLAVGGPAPEAKNIMENRSWSPNTLPLYGKMCLLLNRA